jgi:phosphoribosyl-dephospho-CoA transferase
MLCDRPPAVHALLRVSDFDALEWEGRRPVWVRAQLQRAPWVVVRRSEQRPGVWPVGVRGSLRAQRCAAWLPDCAVEDCVTPQLLSVRRAWRQHRGSDANPPFVVLEEVAAILAAHGHAGRWGPCGSVGFELATALPCTTPDSDLDLVLQADRPIARDDACRLHADLSKLPVRIDLLLEMPHGAVALSEYAMAGGMLLLRCPQGPRLVRDPWSADGLVASSA